MFEGADVTAGIDPDAPLAGTIRIAGVSVTGIEALDVEDAAQDVECALTVLAAWVPEWQRDAVA